MSESKGQLHQLLAVESDLQNRSANAASEGLATFKKHERFIGKVRTLKMFDAGREQEETTEVQEMATTVKDKLNYIIDQTIPYWDAFYKKEATNQEARADIVVDGEVLASAVPATALLGFETKLKRFRELCSQLPTLHPGVAWERQTDGTYVDSKPTEKIKTEKDFEFRVAYQATKEHPAQVEKLSRDKAVGKYTDEVRSGMISSGEKSELLDRIDKLLIAVKRARQQANTQNISGDKIAAKMFEFISKGTFLGS